MKYKQKINNATRVRFAPFMKQRGLVGRWVLFAALLTVTSCSTGNTGSTEAEPPDGPEAAAEATATVEPVEVTTTTASTTTTVAPSYENPSLITGATDDTDFDAAYRHLDGVRERASNEEDSETLAKVTSNKSKLAKIDREANDIETRIDDSDTTYNIETVEVFWVVDENNVLLRVEDTYTGNSTRVDLEGNVIEEFSGREEPLSTFIVWVEREEGGSWLIAEDDWVPNEFPKQLDDFDEADRGDFGDAEVTLFTNSFDTGFCYILAVDGSVPIPACLEVEDQPLVPVHLSYLLDRDERFEVMLFLAVDEEVRFGYTTNDDPLTALAIDVGNSWKAGWWIESPDVVEQFDLRPLDPTLELVVDFDLDAGREQVRNYRNGIIDE